MNAEILPYSRSQKTRLPRASKLHRLSTLLALNLVLALGFRVLARDINVPGWDIVALGRGAWLCGTTGGFFQSLDSYTPFTGAWSSLLYVHLAGWLSTVWPSLFWSHTITLIGATIAFLLLRSSLGGSRRATAGIALCAGASPTLLSYAVAGSSYMSAACTYALAIWSVQKVRSAWATLAIGIFAIFLSFELHDFGRTAFTVYFAASLFLPGRSSLLRATWIGIGVSHLWLVLSFPTGDTAYHSHPVWTAVPFVRIAELGRLIFVEWYPDLPFLLTAGIVSSVFAKKDAWFWRTLVFVQIGLILVLSFNDDSIPGPLKLYPRRFVLLSFVCLAATAARLMHRDACTRLVIGLLAVGNSLQWWYTFGWANQRVREFSLPYTHTRLDSWNDPSTAALAKMIVAEARAGRRVLLLYSYASIKENSTSPAGLLQRVLLQLGPEEYRDRIFMFEWSDPPRRIHWFSQQKLSESSNELDALSDWFAVLRTCDSDTWEPYADSMATLSRIARQWSFRSEPLGLPETDGCKNLRISFSPSGERSQPAELLPSPRHALESWLARNEDRQDGGRGSAAAFEANERRDQR